MRLSPSKASAVTVALEVVAGPGRVQHLDLAAREGGLDALLYVLRGGHLAS